VGSVNFLRRIANLIPVIAAAVDAIEAQPYIVGGAIKQDAALTIVRAGIAVAEDPAVAALVRHPDFARAVAVAIDAIVAVNNVAAGGPPADLKL
jgi:hypothetical protein